MLTQSPTGNLGSRKYLVASLDPEPRPHGTRHVQRLPTATAVDPDAPLEDGDGGAGLDREVGQGSSIPASRGTGPTRPARAALMLKEMGVPLLIHQPVYTSVLQPLDRGRLLDALAGVAPAASASRAALAGLLFTDGNISAACAGPIRAPQNRFLLRSRGYPGTGTAQLNQLSALIAKRRDRGPRPARLSGCSATRTSPRRLSGRRRWLTSFDNSARRTEGAGTFIGRNGPGRSIGR